MSLGLVREDSAPLRPAPGRRSAAFVQIDPRLLEEATFLALRGHPDLRRFDSERTRVYLVEDPEGRERRFRDLHAAWFVRLGLDQPLRQAFDEQPSIERAARACLVACALSPRDEGADLHVEAAAGHPRGAGQPPDRSGPSLDGGVRTVIIRLRPEAFGLPAPLLAFLRHELQHIADIVDPIFGYDPALPEAGADPARQRIILARYAAVWDVTVDGRLSRAGRAGAEARAACRRGFELAFPALGARGEALFERLFLGDRPTHADLMAIARHPEASLSGEAGGPARRDLTVGSSPARKQGTVA